MKKNIIVFGSSISWGAWDVEGGWVTRLKKLISEKVIKTNQKYWAIIYNQSVSGGVSTDILKKFEKETLERIKKDQEVIIIFEVGINDSVYINTEKKFKVSKKIFSKNIEKLIKKASKITNHIFFIGAPPVIDEILDPNPRHFNESLFTKHIKDFNQIISDQCSKQNIKYIDIFSEFQKRNLQDFMFSDGYHPNTKGHKLIYELVKKSLNKYLL